MSRSIKGCNWRALIGGLVFGLAAAACAGSTSEADAGAADITTEAPAVAEEVDDTTAPEESDEIAESEPAAEEEPAAPEEIPEEAPTDEPASTSEAEAPVEETAAPVEETAVEVSPLFEGSFVDLNGEAIDLASFEGQDVVLWFWAPW